MSEDPGPSVTSITLVLLSWYQVICVTFISSMWQLHFELLPSTDPGWSSDWSSALTCTTKLTHACRNNTYENESGVWQWSPTLSCCSLACEHLSDPGHVDHIRLCVILNCVYFVQHQEITNKKNTDRTSTVCTWRCAEARRSNTDASERAQCL